MSVVARIARALEGGSVPRWAIARAAAQGWGKITSRSVARPLRLPDGVRVVAIGGATLGGSGKTPLAVAMARSAATDAGANVVLVGHGYRASTREPRWVAPDDPVQLVGDEALACARVLAGASCRARVVVARRRQDAIDFAAAEGATVLVVDGVAQTAPRRASLALLAVDADDPWGAGELPPLGDLRAPIASLLDACDEIITLRDPLASPSDVATSLSVSRPVRVVDIASRGVWLAGALVPWSDLASLRVGLVTAIARPARVMAFLQRRGIRPLDVAFGPDHVAPPLAAISARPTKAIDLWLTTAKCAAHATTADGRLHEWARRALSGAPLAHIDHMATPP